MMLKIAGLSKAYRNVQGEETEALKHIDLDVEKGSFCCILGPSGCGKTTLLRIVAGLEFPTGGCVSVNGHAMGKPTQEIGFVFQDPALFPWLTVLENIEFGLARRGGRRKERRERAHQLLRFIKLEGFDACYPKELSTGMKQRVAIARTLATDPEVLLMDEPFGAVDAQTREYLQEELIEIWQRSGKTILFVTHSIEEAIFLGQLVIGLSSRPATIKKKVNVNLSFPRDRTGGDFNEFRRELYAYIKAEELSGRPDGSSFIHSGF